MTKIFKLSQININIHPLTWHIKPIRIPGMAQTIYGPKDADKISFLCFTMVLVD
jgi:hypothetical protein